MVKYIIMYIRSRLDMGRCYDMAELTEEQLLLLDNLMYFDGSGERNCTVGTIAEKLKEKTQNYNKSTLALSGGFEDNPKQAEEIAKAVLSDKTLCKLYLNP